jgi:predicted RNase H-like nuclease (RuvC/YqgF family)
LGPGEDKQAAQQDRTEIEDLHHQLSALENKLENSRTRSQIFERELAADKAQMAKMTADRDSLTAQLINAQA